VTFDWFEIGCEVGAPEEGLGDQSPGASRGGHLVDLPEHLLDQFPRAGLQVEPRLVESPDVPVDEGGPVGPGRDLLLVDEPTDEIEGEVAEDGAGGILAAHVCLGPSRRGCPTSIQVY
jgi:hypothetical protein